MNKERKRFLDRSMLYTYGENMSTIWANVSVSACVTFMYYTLYQVRDFFSGQCYKGDMRKQRVKRAFAFAWLEYNSNDWDSKYLGNVISLKLKYMIEHFEKYDCHTQGHTYIAQMKLVRGLLARISDNDYMTEKEREYMDEQYKLWEWIDCPDHEGMSELKMNKPRNDRSRFILDKSMKLEAHDVDFVWEIFRKHYRKWWS